MCVVLQFIWHLLQSTWHPIVCEFSNFASSCISFHIHCNQLPRSYHFLILNCALSCNSLLIYCNRLDFKLCVFLHLFPHSVQSTCHSIIFWIWNLRCPLSLSTLNAIDLLSYHFLILKFALSCNSFHIYCISEFSNCASSCISFHIDCNRLLSYHFLILKLCVILQFSPYLLQSTWLQIVPILALISTFSAIDLLSFHFLTLKLCVVLQFIPHLLQSTWHPIIWEFSNCSPSCISFHIHCNWLVLRSFVNFQIVRLLAPNSTFIAIDLQFYHFLILKFCIVLLLFPHWLQSTCYPVIF